MKRFQQESRERHNDFVECLVFSNSTGVIMTGRYTDGTEPNKVTILYIAVTMLYIVVTMLNDDDNTYHDTAIYCTIQ